MTQASEPLSPSSSLAAEYKRLEQLIDYAAQGHDISRFGGHAVLYVNPDTHRIIDSNLYALSMTGYTRDQLVGLPLEDLEVPIGMADPPRTYVENSVVEHVYMCSYRQRSGHLIPVEVHRRLLYKNEDRVLYYRIEDRSTVSRLWRELQRREDAGFQFEQRLKALNELTMELRGIDAEDALCYQTMKVGVERWGFDCMGMWFCNVENGEMVGPYAGLTKLAHPPGA
ncbi:MAG: PAS domain-containing protein [Chloroflexi bacterium]|uniref:PAS domain-containing protein n=1 Tax=Candidatus Flexifilum breve TaxID=3140694 RepID=UPI003135A7E4|nr:PAS domain-containing protein [Chloroflexota bacterium]